MKITNRDVLKNTLATLTKGEQIHKLTAELYAICRSVTGDGVRETLNIVGRPSHFNWISANNPVSIFLSAGKLRINLSNADCSPITRFYENTIDSQQI